MTEQHTEAPVNRSAKFVATLVVIALAVLTVLYALMDRKAPSSSRGIVSAQVVQIAPRVSGEVILVQVEDDAVVEAGQPLFTIDSRPFELALRQAEARLAREVPSPSPRALRTAAASLRAVTTASRVSRSCAM